MSISSNLRQLRISGGMTQEQAAEKLGVTRQALSSYETGRTRPDIDMLMRLAEVYGTNLNSILYGQEQEQKARRQIKAAAFLLLALLAGLALTSAVLLWSANFFFPLADGQFAQDGAQILEARLRLTEAWKIVDSISLALSFIGFALLLLLLNRKYHPPFRHRLIYMAALAGGLILLPLPFALADPVFAPINYFFTSIHIIIRMLLFFAIQLLIEAVQKKRR